MSCLHKISCSVQAATASWSYSCTRMALVGAFSVIVKTDGSACSQVNATSPSFIPPPRWAPVTGWGTLARLSSPRQHHTRGGGIHYSAFCSDDNNNNVVKPTAAKTPINQKSGGWEPKSRVWCGDSSSSSVGTRAANDPSVFTITEKVHIRAFSWLKAPTSTFTFKTLDIKSRY